MRYILCLCFLFINCSEERTVYELPDHPEDLIAGQKSKTYKIAQRYNGKTRMNMAGCFLSYRIQYNADGSFKDNNGEQEDCGTSLEGKWSIEKNEKGDSFIKIKSELIPQLMGIEEDYKYMRIDYLSKDSLKLVYDHKQYGNTKRTITDLYVLEHIPVKNRDFHYK